MFAAGIGVLLSYMSLFCLSVLFSPRYAIFRVFLSSFSLSLLARGDKSIAGQAIFSMASR